MILMHADFFYFFFFHLSFHYVFNNIIVFYTGFFFCFLCRTDSRTYTEIMIVARVQWRIQEGVPLPPYRKKKIIIMNMESVNDRRRDNLYLYDKPSLMKNDSKKKFGKNHVWKCSEFYDYHQNFSSKPL